MDSFLGWPKSSFGFFCNVLWKPEQTFWPTQYIDASKILSQLYQAGVQILVFFKCPNHVTGQEAEELDIRTSVHSFPSAQHPPLANISHSCRKYNNHT